MSVPFFQNRPCSINEYLSFPDKIEIFCDNLSVLFDSSPIRNEIQLLTFEMVLKLIADMKVSIEHRTTCKYDEIKANINESTVLIIK